MTDSAQNVFGAKGFWALPRTGCRTTEVVIGAIYIRQAGRQMEEVCYGIVEVCVGDGGGVCRGWWRCVYGIVEVCVGWWRCV